LAAIYSSVNLATRKLKFSPGVNLSQVKNYWCKKDRSILQTKSVIRFRHCFFWSRYG